MQPANLTVPHEAQEQEARFLFLATSNAHHHCALIQNTQACPLAATSGMSIVTGTHFP